MTKTSVVLTVTCEATENAPLFCNTVIGSKLSCLFFMDTNLDFLICVSTIDYMIFIGCEVNKHSKLCIYLMCLINLKYYK